jgi:hypothetical protein
MFQYDIAQLAVPKRPKVGSKNVCLTGTKKPETAKSANQCPRNLIQTFYDHGLGYP